MGLSLDTKYAGGKKKGNTKGGARRKSVSGGAKGGLTSH